MAEINVTPLVDVMLVLLIIFMIAAPVLMHRSEVTLPQSGREKVAGDPIELRIAIDGGLTWNGTTLPRAALEPQLALEARRKPQPVLKIDAAASARYEDVAIVLAAAQRAGIESIGFADASMP